MTAAFINKLFQGGGKNPFLFDYSKKHPRSKIGTHATLVA
jgi:hypothetical protein